MPSTSYENLKPIRFEGELLPNWAQLLDLAAEFCRLSKDTREWFSKFTNSSGSDDARTVIHHCEPLKKGIQTNNEAITVELRRTVEDEQPSQIIAAWQYALDTIMQAASTRKTCSWCVEGMEEER